jgi:TonB-dependent SusC/RagA subfamily outer membrane receptor
MKSRILIFVLIAACLPLVAYGQKTDAKSKKKITITGIVTDVNRNPVAGAMIIIDKKNTKVVTDSNGSYKIKTSPDAGLITVFTFNDGVGEEQIEGRTTINITLKGATSAQNNRKDNIESDAAVNVGYGSVKSKNLTTPVSTLDVSNNKYDSYTNVYDMLRGTVPGVQVNGKSIRIQGASSLMASTEPLFVVDGIIVPSIDDISPGQIKSIEILKGASASVYGSRGANGVIMIRMKGSSDQK